MNPWPRPPVSFHSKGFGAEFIDKALRYDKVYSQKDQSDHGKYKRIKRDKHKYKEYCSDYEWQQTV